MVRLWRVRPPLPQPALRDPWESAESRGRSSPLQSFLDQPADRLAAGRQVFLFSAPVVNVGHRPADSQKPIPPFSIDDSRIRNPEICDRNKVLAYRRECYQVLFEHFYGKAAKPLAEGAESEESEGLRLRMVNETRQTFGVQAAGELWFKFGLPVVPAMIKPAGRDLFSSSAVDIEGDQSAASLHRAVREDRGTVGGSQDRRARSCSLRPHAGAGRSRPGRRPSDRAASCAECPARGRLAADASRVDELARPCRCLDRAWTGRGTP